MHAEPPVEGIEAAVVGKDAREARKLDGHHLVAGLRSHQPRPLELATDREDILERSMHSGTRIAGRVEADLERHADRSEDVLGERHLGPLRHVLGENPERLVRVDPVEPGLCDRRSSFERKPRRVCEQVTHRRPRRPCSFVEVDHALLRGHEARERRHGLRDGGEPHAPARVTVRVAAAFAIDDSCCGELDGPLVDLAKRLHARRY